MDFMGAMPVEKGTYDVIVVGGGIAGIAAAVSASREGASVLLIEKGVNLGGLATSGLISWYEPLCDGRGTQMIYGIAEELIKLSVQYGLDNLPDCWNGHQAATDGHERYSTFFSPTVFSIVLDQYVLENHVDIRFDTLATYPVMDQNLCKGIVVESVSGREFFGCKAVIDATGDASISHRAGVPTVAGKNYMSYVVHYYNKETAKTLAKGGDTCRFRTWLNPGSDMYGNGQPASMEPVSGITAEEVTQYVIAGKKLVFEKIKNWDKHDYDLMTIPSMPQFRTIRRIVGDCDFEAIHGKTYPDSIGTCGDFRPSGIGNHYQIPAGALYNSNFPNIFAAGRIISAPQGDGWEVARVIPVCALTGEAAGKLACDCIHV